MRRAILSDLKKPATHPRQLRSASHQRRVPSFRERVLMEYVLAKSRNSSLSIGSKNLIPSAL